MPPTGRPKYSVQPPGRPSSLSATKRITSEITKIAVITPARMSTGLLFFMRVFLSFSGFTTAARPPNVAVAPPRWPGQSRCQGQATSSSNDLLTGPAIGLDMSMPLAVPLILYVLPSLVALALPVVPPTPNETPLTLPSATDFTTGGLASVNTAPMPVGTPEEPDPPPMAMLTVPAAVVQATWPLTF